MGSSPRPRAPGAGGRPSGRWLPWVAAAVAAVVGLVLTVVATTATVQRIDDATRTAAEQSAAATAESLTTALWPMEAFNQAVRAYVVADPPRPGDAEASAFMSRLFERWRGFRSAALAPGNTVSTIVPLEGNESVIGLRYPDVPAQWTDIARAIDGRISVFSGPFDLVQGGQGLAYRTPIFLSDGSYWGLVSSVIDVERLLGSDVAGGPGHAVIRDLDRGDRLIVGDDSVDPDAAVYAPVDAFGRHWEVGVAAASPDRSPAAVVALVGVLVTAVVAALVFLLASSRLRSHRLLLLLEGVTAQAPGMLFQYREIHDGPPVVDFASPGLAPLVGDVGTGPEAYATLLHLIHPDDLPRLVDAQRRAVEEERPWTESFRLLLPDGRIRWMRTSARPEREPNGDVVWSGWSGDVTEEMTEQDSLRLSASLFAATRDGVVVLDADGRVADVNAGLTSMTGYTPDDVVGRPFEDYLRGAMAEESIGQFWSQLDRRGYWRGEITGRDRDRRIRTSTASATAVRDESGRISHYLIVLDDINIARDDGVTGLPGARTLDDEVRAAMAAADESGGRVALVIVALDQFRQVNESFGHRIGDAVLRAVGQRLRAVVPSAGVVVRLRGDEFAVLVPAVDDVSVVDRTAHACLNAVAEPIEIDRLVIRVSARAGVSVYPDDPGGPTELAAQANQAMRSAKAGDVSRVVSFSPRMFEEARARTQLVEDLIRALRDPASGGPSGEFSLVLQPVVDLLTGEVHKAEALIRWDHPRRGRVRPDEFIPVAEETGLITDLGDRVFAAAVRAATALRAVDPGFRVGFNLSPVELREGSDRHARRVQTLASSALPGDALVAEITEGALLPQNPTVAANLDRYRSAGVHFAIDDFGTGYSSLAYLRDLDVSYLKIDRTFVDRMQPEGSDLALVRAIIAMAHTMHIEVIAEGVETEPQERLLAEAACDFAQGFGIARPMPIEELLTWLGSRGDRGAGPAVTVP